MCIPTPMHYYCAIRPILSPPILLYTNWHVCLCLSVVRFLPSEEGDFVCTFSVYPGKEVSNTPSYVIGCHISYIITDVRCEGEICALF